MLEGSHHWRSAGDSNVHLKLKCEKPRGDHKKLDRTSHLPPETTKRSFRGQSQTHPDSERGTARVPITRHCFGRLPSSRRLLHSKESRKRIINRELLKLRFVWRVRSDYEVKHCFQNSPEEIYNMKYWTTNTKHGLKMKFDITSTQSRHPAVSDDSNRTLLSCGGTLCEENTRNKCLRYETEISWTQTNYLAIFQAGLRTNNIVKPG